ncbi:MAG TPA: glutathione S-transferase [Caulobacteraceae bacterium]|jgi:glutathione S-transferase
MLKLYHAPDSRSSRFIWLLEELGADYEPVRCTIQRRSGAGAPDPRNPHPDKRVPALEHDGQLITEQAAIALYLTDLFRQSPIGAPPGSPDRGAYLTWLAFHAGEIDVAYNTRALGLGTAEPTVLRDHRRVAERVAAALAKGPFLLGARFTAADILASGPFEWDPELGARSPVIVDWVGRLAARPAAARMRALDAEG